jgi:hypothetical protein
MKVATRFMSAGAAVLMVPFGNYRLEALSYACQLFTCFETSTAPRKHAAGTGGQRTLNPGRQRLPLGIGRLPRVFALASLYEQFGFECSVDLAWTITTYRCPTKVKTVAWDWPIDRFPFGCRLARCDDTRHEATGYDQSGCNYNGYDCSHRSLLLWMRLSAPMIALLAQSNCEHPHTL